VRENIILCDLCKGRINDEADVCNISFVATINGEIIERKGEYHRGCAVKVINEAVNPDVRLKVAV
jgi:hypothetical protein